LFKSWAAFFSEKNVFLQNDFSNINFQFVGLLPDFASKIDEFVAKISFKITGFSSKNALFYKLETT